MALFGFSGPGVPDSLYALVPGCFHWAVSNGEHLDRGDIGPRWSLSILGGPQRPPDEVFVGRATPDLGTTPLRSVDKFTAMAHDAWIWRMNCKCDALCTRGGAPARRTHGSRGVVRHKVMFARYLRVSML